MLIFTGYRPPIGGALEIALACAMIDCYICCQKVSQRAVVITMLYV
jgi:hypothetical protein